jgi:hypothetical protein
MTRLLLILAFFVTAVSAVEPKGFEEIPFGLKQNEVVEAAFKMGESPEVQSNSVVIPQYHLGDLLVKVTLKFNRSGLFYSYELRTGFIERDRLAKVIEAARYMSEQLELTFGPPFKKKFSRIEELENKKRSPFWLWNNPEVDVATYIQTEDIRFYTQCTVTSKQLGRVR